MSSTEGHRSLRICCVLSLQLFEKCQHVVTNASHLSYRYPDQGQTQTVPHAEVPAELPKTEHYSLLFTSPAGLDRQAVPQHGAKRSGVPLGLAGRSRQPRVRNPDSLPDPQMGSQSQTQSHPPGQGEGLLPSCELPGQPKQRSCICELQVKGMQDKVTLRCVGCGESPLAWRGPAQRPIRH